MRDAWLYFWKFTVIGNGNQGIRVTLKHQSRFNRNVGLWACAMTAYVVMTELDRREQNKKIKELRNEIEELKRSEGE